MIGMGIIKQSKANEIDVAREVHAEIAKLQKTLPEGMDLGINNDNTVFIQAAIDEVYKTLGVAVVLVVAVIYLFLGSARATIIPAVTVPVCLIASFIVLKALGFTVNLMTLLALVLAIGLVVDDAIVVLENIHRRIELGEPPLLGGLSRRAAGRLRRRVHDSGSDRGVRADHVPDRHDGSHVRRTGGGFGGGGRLLGIHRAHSDADDVLEDS